MLRNPIERYVAGGCLLLMTLLLLVGMARIVPIGLAAAGVRSVDIGTIAMRPTLAPGDSVVAHRNKTLHLWDIVIFHPPGRQDIFTQRIAGLPGEKVEIVGGQLRINDVPATPPPGVGPYAGHVNFGPQTGCEGKPILLGPGEYFVLCDNPVSTYDSRSFPVTAEGHQVGAVPLEAILGRVTAVVSPFRFRHFK
jgi:signal peptidase I